MNVTSSAPGDGATEKTRPINDLAAQAGLPQTDKNMPALLLDRCEAGYFRSEL